MSLLKAILMDAVFDWTLQMQIFFGVSAFRIHCFEGYLRKTHLSFFVVTRPLPRDGGMAEHHGAPEAGKLSAV